LRHRPQPSKLGRPAGLVTGGVVVAAGAQLGLDRDPGDRALAPLGVGMVAGAQPLGGAGAERERLLAVAGEPVLLGVAVVG
jgi:hypothetical protein